MPAPHPADQDALAGKFGGRNSRRSAISIQKWQQRGVHENAVNQIAALFELRPSFKNGRSSSMIAATNCPEQVAA